MKRNIRFAGSGGQGVILSSVLLAKAYGLGGGYNISQTQSYGPEARGGACKAELVVSDQEIDYMKVDKADVFVALNQSGYEKYIGATRKDAIILINSTLVQADIPGRVEVPATDIAEELGAPLVVNMVMLGALSGLLNDLKYDMMKSEVLRNIDAKYLDINLAAFEKGYGYTEQLIGAETTKSRSKVMVCVTTQKTCDRLIRRGKKLLESDGELSIVHIADSQFRNFDNAQDGEALDYLYENALKHGTNLMIIRSNDVISTMENLVERNEIGTIVLGESREISAEKNLIMKLRERLRDKAELIVVPMTQAG